MTRGAARVLDEYLAASARAGDRVAFARLAVRWQPKLLAHAYRLMGDMEFARDVAQGKLGRYRKGVASLARQRSISCLVLSDCHPPRCGRYQAPFNVREKPTRLMLRNRLTMSVQQTRWKQTQTVVL